jgi:S1-C subfamily serine protease
MLPMLVPGIPGTSLSLAERWERLEATPRLSGKGGTGTAVVIGRSNDEIYLLTAEHVTRNSSDLKLEFFERATYPKVSRIERYGSVVEDFSNPDFAVLKFPLSKKEYRYPEVRLATVAERPKRFPFNGMTIGCSNGSPPTCEAVTVVAKRLARRLNDQEIAFFWETEQIPSPGRSGGPIFDGTGRLIGICSATTGGKGFYTHLDEILAGLKEKKLVWLLGEESPKKQKNR